MGKKKKKKKKNINSAKAGPKPSCKKEDGCFWKTIFDEL
jgi:hypothetical protein